MLFSIYINQPRSWSIQLLSITAFKTIREQFVIWQMCAPAFSTCYPTCRTTSSPLHRCLVITITFHLTKSPRLLPRPSRLLVRLGIWHFLRVYVGYDYACSVIFYDYICHFKRTQRTLKGPLPIKNCRHISPRLLCDLSVLFLFSLLSV